MAARGMSDRDSKLDKKSSHLLLLAENETGYQNLLKIASAAQMDGFYYYPRIDHDFLAAHSEGLIATSGCMSAEIPRTLLDESPEEAVASDELVLRCLRPGPLLRRAAAAQHPRTGRPEQETGRTGRANIRPSSSPPTMCITSSRTMPTTRISCSPSRPARCSPTRTACA